MAPIPATNISSAIYKSVSKYFQEIKANTMSRPPVYIIFLYPVTREVPQCGQKVVFLDTSRWHLGHFIGAMRG